MKYASLLKASVASAVILAGSSAVYAADAPIYDKGVVTAPVVAPVWTWAGFYGGLFAGYAWGDVETVHPATGGGVAYSAATVGSYDVDDSDGFFGGGTLGYNWQSDNFVFGLEGELGYLDIGGSEIDPWASAIGFTDLRADADTDFYMSLTGRAGFAFDQLLLYVKGGGTFLNAEVAMTDACAGGANCSATTYAASDDDWQGGWTVGAGAEWMIGGGWSTKLEYMYYDFGDTSVSAVASNGLTYSSDFDLSAQTVKVGLNYHF